VFGASDLSLLFFTDSYNKLKKERDRLHKERPKEAKRAASFHADQPRKAFVKGQHFLKDLVGSSRSHKMKTFEVIESVMATHKNVEEIGFLKKVSTSHQDLGNGPTSGSSKLLFRRRRI